MTEEQYYRYYKFLERKIHESRASWRDQSAWKEALDALMAIRHGWPTAPQ